MEALQPLVFVAMPFGKKLDQTRSYEIDFNRIYEIGIRPAVARFPLDIIRADEERSGGVIHKPMFERLLLAEIAIVDATTHNANVFYELGVRHAARPGSTIIVTTSEGPLPFDIAMIRTVQYTLERGVLTDANAAAFVDALARRLESALSDLQNDQDSPLFQLIPQFPGIELPHDACEGFRDRAHYVDGATRLRDLDQLVAAAGQATSLDGFLTDLALDPPSSSADYGGLAAVTKIREIEDEIGKKSPANAELAMDVMLAYRGLDLKESWENIVRLFEGLDKSTREGSITMREQYGLALNRLYKFNKGDERKRALKVLTSIIDSAGDSPETCALIGRIYKDQYTEAKAAGEGVKAAGFLEHAIEWYSRGFTADPRDYFPGVNAATLLAVQNTPESKVELQRLVPAVSFAAARLGGMKSSDYWQVATVLELAVLGGQWSDAQRALGRALTLNPDPMQCNTTSANLKLYQALYEGDDAARVGEIVAALEAVHALA